MDKAIEKFKGHLSIRAITENIIPTVFNFLQVNNDAILKETTKLDAKG